MTYETRERRVVGSSSGTAFGGPLDSQHCSDLLIDTTMIYGPRVGKMVLPYLKIMQWLFSNAFSTQDPKLYGSRRVSRQDQKSV